jgi:hypothetical protein
MPVYKLTAEMPYQEFLSWVAYFERRPVDWRDDDRTFKYLQTQGVKEKPWAIFPSLQPIYNGASISNLNLEDGQIGDANAFRGSLVYNKLLAATGGDTIPL